MALTAPNFNIVPAALPELKGQNGPIRAPRPAALLLSVVNIILSYLLHSASEETPMTVQLTPELASKFASLALAHLTREYPNKLTHSLEGPHDVQGPRALHPIFYGSYDWHSCVHGYWLVLRVLERYPALPEAERIVATVDAHFTEANVAGE